MKILLMCSNFLPALEGGAERQCRLQATELARRGYARAELEKIASGNILRVMRAAESYAAAHRGDPPYETPVPD